jgi:hypothetical protein
MTLRGELSEGAIPGILRHLYLQRSTGLLHLSRVVSARTICFGKGRIVGAIASAPEADLGAVLLRSDRLSPDELACAREARARLGRSLSDILIELGLTTRDDVEQTIASIVRSTLSEVFSWPDGTFEFEECALARVLKADVALKLSTAELILESVRAVSDPRAIHSALGNTERRLAMSTTPVLSVPQSSLSPADAFVLSRVDGVLTTREIVEIAPLTAAEVERSLFGLLCVGIIEYLPFREERTRQRTAGSTRSTAHEGEGEAAQRGQKRSPVPSAGETAPLEVAESYALAVEQMWAEGRHADLIVMVERVLAYMPESTQVRLRILQARAHLADPDSARRGIEVLQDIVEGHPAETEPRVLLGQAYAGAGMKQRAISILQKVLEQEPHHHEAAHELRRLEQEP